MMELPLATIAEFAQGALAAGAPDRIARGVTTDTRSLADGQVFVALVGDRYDGHDYLGMAVERGAAAVMVADDFAGVVPDGCAVVRVADTLVGLQCLARRYRRHLGIKAVGITGSNGKTSTKDLTASVLGESLRVNATVGNLNNHIGLPLTILATDPAHQCGVWEMGMSNPGEIEVLADIARPDVGVITNIGVAHLESLKSREAIAEEKGMLAEAIDPSGLVVLGAGQDFTPAIRRRTCARVITTGIGDGNITANALRQIEGGTEFVVDVGTARRTATIPAIGRHMVENALMAVAVGVEFGLDLETIVAGLANARFTGGRLQRSEKHGVILIDDSYNANPDSMRAALDAFVAIACAGRRFAVLGGMAELGESSADAHRALGRDASRSGIDVLVSVGDGGRLLTADLNGSAPAVVKHFDTHADCAAFLRSATQKGDCVLVKGSRSAAMERVLEHFRREP